MPKRCALGCPLLGVPMHTFPHSEKFPETFKAWVEIVGGKLETPDDYALYRTKMICDIHFVDRHKHRNYRLNALAVPTLCIPDLTMKNILEPNSKDAPKQPALASIENHIEYSTDTSALSINIVQPSTSKEYPCLPSHMNLQKASTENITDLTDLKFFLKENPMVSDGPEEENKLTIFNEDVLLPEKVEEDIGQRNYVCGWVLTKCMKHVIKGCKTCKEELLARDGDNRKNNEYIKAKEYNKKRDGKFIYHKNAKRPSKTLNT